MGCTLLKSFRPNNLFESFKILKFITFFNGLLPFHLSEDGKTVRLTNRSIISFVLHYIFFLICFVMSLEESHQINETFFKSNVSHFVSVTHRITNCGGMTFLFVAFLLMRKHLQKMIQLIVNVDRLFRKLSVKVKYQDITNTTLYLTAGLFLFKLNYNVACTVLFGTHKKPSFLMQVVFILPSAFKWIYVLVFVILVYSIKICLKGINQVRLSTTLPNIFKTFMFLHTDPQESDSDLL